MVEGIEVDGEEDPRPVLETVVHGRVDSRVPGRSPSGVVEAGGVTAKGLVDGVAAKAVVGDRLEFPGWIAFSGSDVVLGLVR